MPSLIGTKQQVLKVWPLEQILQYYTSIMQHNLSGAWKQYNLRAWFQWRIASFLALPK